METDDLGWIPRPVRAKLDHVGIKLHLKEWQAFPLKDRHALCALPCQTSVEKRTFQERLDTLALRHCGALPQRLPPDRSDGNN